MRMKPLVNSLVVSAIVLFLFAVDAIACSCSDRPTLTEQLDRYTKVVVAGRIESVHKLREEERKYDFGAYRSATLVVEKVYVGNVKVGDRLVLAQTTGADCGFDWDDKAVGGKWLFYSGDPSTQYHERLENRPLDDNEK